MSALDEIVKNHPKIAEELVELRRDNLYLLSENNRLIFNNGKLSTEISDLRSTIKQLSNIRSDNILLLKQVDEARDAIREAKNYFDNCNPFIGYPRGQRWLAANPKESE